MVIKGSPPELSDFLRFSPPPLAASDERSGVVDVIIHATSVRLAAIPVKSAAMGRQSQPGARSHEQEGNLRAVVLCGSMSLWPLGVRSIFPLFSAQIREEGRQNARIGGGIGGIRHRKPLRSRQIAATETQPSSTHRMRGWDGSTNPQV